MLKKGSIKLFLAMVSFSMALGMAACGNEQEVVHNRDEEVDREESIGKDKEKDEKEEPTKDSNENAGENSNETQEEMTSEHLDALLGPWKLLVTIDGELYEVHEDLEFTGSLDIYKEDGKYKIDYIDNEYSFREIYGMELQEVEKPKYEGNDKGDWYVQFNRKRDENGYYDIVQLTEDTLKLHIHYSYNYEDYETGEPVDYSLDSYHVYVKEDSENLEQIKNQYRYLKTVTVTNMKELYEAIDSNTHIILKEGVYNISSLPDFERNNENMNYQFNYETGDKVFTAYDTMNIIEVNNLFLEGEEGAKVQISTEDGYEIPLSFAGCERIVLKNLTVGHEVEPGQCSGAVVGLQNSYYIDIQECNLYGSGTYGIEATNSYHINVTDTDIYECTYGLVYINGCGVVSMKNCNLRDSSEFSMIDLYGSWDMIFEDCKISNNISRGEQPLIFGNACENVVFRNCVFQGNQYSIFSEGEVELHNCTVSDK